jgi:hypothetical protein
VKHGVKFDIIHSLHYYYNQSRSSTNAHNKLKFTLEQALDGGGWLTPHRGRFTPGNDPVPIVQGAVAKNILKPERMMWHFLNDPDNIPG